MTNKIDPTKPLELDNGTPVTLERVSSDGKSIAVRLPAGASHRRVPYQTSSGGGVWSYYIRNGVWCGAADSHYHTIRNVTPKFSVGDRVITSTGVKGTVASVNADDGEFFVDYDDGQGLAPYDSRGTGWKMDGSKLYASAYIHGTRIRDYTTISKLEEPATPDVSVGDELRFVGGAGLTAKVTRIGHGCAYIETAGGGASWLVRLSDMTDEDGDTWTPEKAEPTSVWQNIYDDGTIGATEHASMEDASDRCKYFKTRVGFLETTRDGDGMLIASKVHSTAPTRRTPMGRSNPYE